MTLHRATYARHQYVTPVGHRPYRNRIVMCMWRRWWRGSEGYVFDILARSPAGRQHVEEEGLDQGVKGGRSQASAVRSEWGERCMNLTLTTTNNTSRLNHTSISKSIDQRFMKGSESWIGLATHIILLAKSIIISIAIYVLTLSFLSESVINVYVKVEKGRKSYLYSIFHVTKVLAILLSHKVHFCNYLVISVNIYWS